MVRARPWWFNAWCVFMPNNKVQELIGRLPIEAKEIDYTKVCDRAYYALRILEARQNKENGGWGETEYSSSKVLSTSRILQALSEIEVAEEECKRGLKYLERCYKIQKDGNCGWGEYEATVRIDEKNTAYALCTLQRVDGWQEKFLAGALFLLRTHIGGRGWFQGSGYQRVSDVVTTYWAISALRQILSHQHLSTENVNEVEKAIADAINWLKDCQELKEGGGYRAAAIPELSADVLSTSFAIRALAEDKYRCKHQLQITKGVKWLKDNMKEGFYWEPDEANELLAPWWTAEAVITLLTVYGNKFATETEEGETLVKALNWLLEAKQQEILGKETGWVAMCLTIMAKIMKRNEGVWNFGQSIFRYYLEGERQREELVRKLKEKEEIINEIGMGRLNSALTMSFTVNLVLIALLLWVRFPDFWPYITGIFSLITLFVWRFRDRLFHRIKVGRAQKR